MLVTIPFMCRVVSVHRLNTATSSPIRAMSCSTVSDVLTASSPPWCAWMSCREGHAVHFSGQARMGASGCRSIYWTGTRPDIMINACPKPPSQSPSLLALLFQILTHDDSAFQRKIK